MPLTIDDLTTKTLDGTGVFDVLMAAVEGHIKQEYERSRIRGPEYSTVYLGAMQAVLDRALQFLLSKEKTDREVALIDAQISKMAKEEALVDAQILNAGADKLRIEADTARLSQQTANLLAEAANIPKQGLVLDAQKCKLDAEFDLLVEQKLKAIAETALLAQKKVTEQAQTSALGVDADSVVGKQKALYTAQTDGFLRDAEQNVAKILVDTWNVRRTTDSNTIAGQDINGGVDNRLGDADIARAIDKLLTGIGA